MRVLACIAVLALMAIAGCASPSTTNGTGSSSSGAAPTHDHSAHTIEVDLKGTKFVNQTVGIYQGDTIHWVHMDGTIGHSVTSDTGVTPSFDNKPNCVSGAEGSIPTGFCMVNGDTFSFTFNDVGKVTYHCRAHPNMTGTINVMAHPAA